MSAFNPVISRLSQPELMQMYQRSQPKKPREPDPNLARDLEHGWLFDYLIPLESMTCGRWNYWAELQLSGALLEAPIPALSFSSLQSAEPGRKMLTRCLNSIAGGSLHGDGWMGWSSFEHFDYLLNWLLFGFGHPGQPELPQEPTPGASMRLYQLLDLAPLLLWPYDHLGQMLAECRHGRSNGFFPTPHEVCEMMTLMVMQDSEMRDKKTCDPACGTGRMLLHAAQYSLRLFGQDIDATMCKATLVNGYLYAPWLPRPIWWLDRATLFRGNSLHSEPGVPFNEAPESESFGSIVRIGQALRMLVESGLEEEGTAAQVLADAKMGQEPEEVPGPNTPSARQDERAETLNMEALRAHSDAMTAQAPPHIQTNLFDTEFDDVGTIETAPIIKRRRVAQPSLFDDPTGDDTP